MTLQIPVGNSILADERSLADLVREQIARWLRRGHKPPTAVELVPLGEADVTDRAKLVAIEAFREAIK